MTRSESTIRALLLSIALLLPAAGYGAVRASTPSKMGNQCCQAWTDAKCEERSAMDAWLDGFLDGEIAALDNYADGNQAAVKMPPLSIDLREMDRVCENHPNASIRQNAVDTFLNGHP